MSYEVSITRKGYIVVDGVNHVEEKEAVEHALNLALQNGADVPISFASMMWVVSAIKKPGGIVVPAPSGLSLVSQLKAVPAAPSPGASFLEMTPADLTADPSALFNAIQNTSYRGVMLHAGTYDASSLSPTRSGTASDPVWVMSYPGEEAWLDFGGSGGNINQHSDYLYWHRLGFKNAAKGRGGSSWTIGVYGAHSRAIYCSFEDSNGTPYMVLENNDNWGLRCASYWSNSAAVDTPGDVDGFSASCNNAYGESNGFSGCLVLNSCDDGIDAWKSFKTIIEGCFLIRVGFKPDGSDWGGDGNGLKLGPGISSGGTWTYPDSSMWYRTDLTARWNLVVYPKTSVLTPNAGANQDVRSNTLVGSVLKEYDAGGAPEPLPAGNIAYAILRNNLLHAGSLSRTGSSPSHEVTNSWDIAGFTTADADFLSTVEPTYADVVGKMGDTIFDMMTTGAFKDLYRLAAGAPEIGAATDLGDGHIDLGAYMAG